MDSNPLIQSLSSSLNVDTSRFLACIVRNSKHEPKGRRWSYKEKVLPVSILKRSPRSYIFLRSLFPLPSRRTLQSLLNTVQFRTGINAHVFSVLKDHVQTMSDVVSCLTKCQSESICILIRRLAVLMAMRTLEDMARQAISQIMPWSSYSAVYVQGGSNQLLTT